MERAAARFLCAALFHFIHHAFQLMLAIFGETMPLYHDLHSSDTQSLKWPTAEATRAVAAGLKR
jgi:hypothetical protein